MRSDTLKIFIVLLFLTNHNSIVYAQFVDISEALGQQIFVTSGSMNGNGMSFYDFNRDGWDDLTISRGTDSPLFFINQQGTYVPVDFNISTHANSHAMMMLWADYDNDGDMDLLITKNIGPIELWQNDGQFNFTNVAAQAGFYPGNYFHNGAAFADFDHDGYLDIYISKYYSGSLNTGEHLEGKLYRNNGNGTFSDVTIAAGVHLGEMMQFEPVFVDYNKDGWEDLLIIVDRIIYQNYLFRNNQDGTFTDVSSETGMNLYFDPMTVSVADFDNDLDLDIYMTNTLNMDDNHLMVNNDLEIFTNDAAEYGVDMNHSSWGAVWIDYDNDSWQDLYVGITTPFVSPYVGGEFYMNQSGEFFIQGRDEVGLGNDFSSTYVCARGDINNDGYFDFGINNRFTHPFKLYQNTTGTNNYISLSFEGTISNKMGIGTWIHCYAGGNSYVRYTLCGENLIAQNSEKEIFGLAEISTIDSLVIDWNRGTRDVYYNVDVNQHLHLLEGITLSQPFEIGLDGDLYLCEGDSLVLDAGEFENYLWSTGETTRYITVFNPGEYSVLVENQFGFEIESNIIVLENAPENQINLMVTDVSCFGAMDGQLEVSFSNIPTQTLMWNTGDTGQVLTNLESGFYSFMGTDSYGCPFIGNVNIAEPSPLIADISTFNTSCFGFDDGAVTTVITGGTAPYNVEIDGFLISELPAGVYNLQISDFNGCVLTSMVEIVDPEELILDLTIENIDETGETGSATLNVIGGTGSYDILWSTGEVDAAEISDLNAGNYWVMVTDENGCTSELSFEIVNTTAIENQLTIVLMISPNPFTECFTVIAPPNTQLTIHDSKGVIVFSTFTNNSGNIFCPLNLSHGTYILTAQSELTIERKRLVKM